MLIKPDIQFNKLSRPVRRAVRLLGDYFLVRELDVSLNGIFSGNRTDVLGVSTFDGLCFYLPCETASDHLINLQSLLGPDFKIIYENNRLFVEYNPKHLSSLG